MSTTLKLPVDSLLEVLHNVTKRRTTTQQGINYYMSQAGRLMREDAELDAQEKDILGALKALGEGDFYEVEEAE